MPHGITGTTLDSSKLASVPQRQAPRFYCCIAMLRASAGRLWRSRSQQPARLVRGWASEAESAKKDGIEEEAASWFKSFAKSKLNVILTGGLVLLGVNFAGTAAFNAYYQHQVVSTLLKGVTPAVEHPSPIARQPLREKIINILKPKVCLQSRSRPVSIISSPGRPGAASRP